MPTHTTSPANRPILFPRPTPIAHNRTGNLAVHVDKYSEGELRVLCTIVGKMSGLNSILVSMGEAEVEWTVKRKLAQGGQSGPVMGQKSQGNKLCAAVAKAINKSPKLTTVELRGVSLPPEAVSKLARALQNNDSVKRLALPNCKIGDRGFAQLADAIRLTTSICELDLTYNELTDRSAAYFGQILKQHTTTRNEHLWAYSLRDDPVDVASHGLLVLDLSHNELGDRTAADMAAQIPIDIWTLAISLGYNQIGATGANVLAEALSKNETLRVLDVRNNPAPDDDEDDKKKGKGKSKGRRTGSGAASAAAAGGTPRSPGARTIDTDATSPRAGRAVGPTAYDGVLELCSSRMLPSAEARPSLWKTLALWDWPYTVEEPPKDPAAEEAKKRGKGRVVRRKWVPRKNKRAAVTASGGSASSASADGAARPATAPSKSRGARTANAVAVAASSEAELNEASTGSPSSAAAGEVRQLRVALRDSEQAHDETKRALDAARAESRRLARRVTALEGELEEARLRQTSASSASGSGSGRASGRGKGTKGGGKGSSGGGGALSKADAKRLDDLRQALADAKDKDGGDGNDEGDDVGASGTPAGAPRSHTEMLVWLEGMVHKMSEDVSKLEQTVPAAAKVAADRDASGGSSTGTGAGASSAGGGSGKGRRPASAGRSRSSGSKASRASSGMGARAASRGSKKH